MSSLTLSPLTLYGLAAVSAMLVTYALEARSRWWVLAFALSCWLASAYGFLQGAWPLGLVEIVWGVVALARWRGRRYAGPPGPATTRRGSPGD